jgi:hypothetical protein
LKQFPFCPCGLANESYIHYFFVCPKYNESRRKLYYFFVCPKYNESRRKLYNSLATLLDVTTVRLTAMSRAVLSIILYGIEREKTTSSCILKFTHVFISESNRFKDFKSYSSSAYHSLGGRGRGLQMVNLMEMHGFLLEQSWCNHLLASALLTHLLFQTTVCSDFYCTDGQLCKTYYL